MDKIDEYGEKRTKIEELKKELKALGQDIIEENNLEPGDARWVTAGTYKIQMKERMTPVISAKKVLKIIKDTNKFLEVVSVSNTKVKKHLSLQQIDKCTDDIKVTVYLECREDK